MIGLILLIFLTILLFIFGIFCLIISLGYPDWFKTFWQHNINVKLPQDLVTKTTIIGSTCTGLSLILLLIIIILFDTYSTSNTCHYSHRKKKAKKAKKAKKGIVLLARKLKKGPSGGSYYTKRKCKGLGKRKKCKMIKIYTK